MDKLEIPETLSFEGNVGELIGGDGARCSSCT